MTEIAGAVPIPNKPKPLILSVQRSDQPITCSANALINAVRICGGEVTSDEEQRLVQQTLDTQDALDRDKDEAPFALAYGYSVEKWRLPASQITSPESIATQFAKRLEDAGPAMLSISSALSRRDRTVAASIGFDEAVLKDKIVVHRVVAGRAGNMVKIIDSYDPQHPEEFDMTDPAQQKLLSAWLISIGIQLSANTASPGIQLNRDDLLQRANDWLNNKFDAFRAMAYMMPTDIENLIPQHA